MSAKRVVDIVVGVPIAIAVVPMVAVLALGSAVVFRTWPIFVQRRVGYRGRIFRLPKLRTLPPSTPGSVDKYTLARYRVPWYGRFLRRTHLDELPQLFLVPFGRMSLVGPRPEMVGLLDRYSEHFATLRTSVRPGCTGLWQVSAASDEMIYEAPQYDTFYVANVSARLDAWIVARTVAGFLPGVAPPLTLDTLPAWGRPIERRVRVMPVLTDRRAAQALVLQTARRAG